ncbi:uracil-DNA glycosylase [Pseudooceanicola sediminis]|uniref:Type-4 uracil-DNA glycosylase n=1 Tax=Pseudooceanicola sediminis TaxID=2211117 RepID=A0A399J2H5_9RHOB|nr:uracil-DNA glycosylase [Pseudooceanicola sediminis]KAA2314585.1 uracil-DNA glycosylase [Puniceibacterium sp. HSS470]RII39545.1 uracil-DNA glycosylase [Pseudooceanicola sediminis]|tara:strand:- start:6476 stop:7273 length:798 start_codon:yes stop_codon:yes gene_type:complete
MESALEWDLARTLLEWQVELGVDECIGEAPVNRFELAPEAPAKPARAAAQVRHAPEEVRERLEVDAVDVARQAAQSAGSLDALRTALDAYDHCELRLGARNLVFADGVPGARVMILGEAPGRDEDREGRPFVGRAGQLLDKMLAAIGLSRTAEDVSRAVYITNVLPWRPPQNRDPKPEEIAMMLPFLQKHVALAKPDVLVLMGNISCQAALGQRGILKLRGHWSEAFGLPALPMTHPAYLLRQPHAKREAWADLLSLSARLGQGR